MTLIATPGDANANSYVTVAAATALLAEQLQTEAWYATAETDMLTLTAKREAALLWATGLLNTHVEWYGTPTTGTQALPCPQAGQVDPLGNAIASDVVP